MANRHITPHDRENADRLKAVWDAKKRQLNLTQVKAAAQLGFATQSTVSQYLNCDIAMNTEVILKFARLLEVDPIRIDPTIRSLVVRELRPGNRTLDVVCRVELSNLGNFCVSKEANESTLTNPFADDLPRGTSVRGVEVGTAAYHTSFGLPHNAVAYILENAEPDINEVLFVQQRDGHAGFYRFNGRTDEGLLLTDPLTGKTLPISVDSIETIGIVVGYHAADLSRRTRWELH